MQPAITTNTNGAVIDWNGGAGTLATRGTYNGATTKAQYCPGDANPDTAGNWADVDNTSMTAPGQINFSLGRGKLRLNVASVGGSTTITHDFLPFLGKASG